VYLLSLHPEVADKIFDELHLIVEDKTSTEAPSFNEEIMQFALLLSYDVIAKLHYLHAAITETIRLYPAVPQVLKTGLIKKKKNPHGNGILSQ
jgi:cytochrome P450